MTKEQVKQKTRANRMRRVANRQGYILQKSNSRNKADIEYGKWRLCDIRTGECVLGENGKFSVGIDDVERFLHIGE